MGEEGDEVQLEDPTDDATMDETKRDTSEQDKEEEVPKADYSLMDELS